VLVSVVPPDEAAGGCAEHAMVTRIVTRYTADNSSLKAPFAEAGADTAVKARRTAAKTAETLILLTCCLR
jgi:hypothetical protein